MTNLINWVIEESVWYTVINMNNTITTQRRFPPYLQKTTPSKNIGTVEEIKIYNRILTEDKWNSVYKIRTIDERMPK